MAIVQNKIVMLVITIMLGTFMLGTLAITSDQVLPSEKYKKSTINITQKFEEWMVEHNRVYSNNSEKEKRYEIFKKNYERMRAKYNNTEPELNIFGDKTEDELPKGGMKIPKIPYCSLFHYFVPEYKISVYEGAVRIRRQHGGQMLYVDKPYEDDTDGTEEDDIDFWLVKNSWGTTCGRKGGYFRIKRNVDKPGGFM
ncbi:probable cysteine protease RDL3 [Rosa chinensis]|nr:probable cysteine protease RDL3 [Rosa chinensis]